jgi:FkbM family methyltransferase
MLLTQINGAILDLARYPALAWHLAEPKCWIKEIVGQINGGLYAGMPIRDTVLDIGANCGMFAAYASPHARVICLEPSVRHALALLKFRHEAKLSNIRISRTALWTYNGSVAIHEDPNNATMDRIDYHEKAVTKLMVPCCRMDTLITLCGAPQVAFVKMDIEGAEEDVLASEGFAAAAPRIGCLWVECHNFKDWGDGKELGDRIEALVRGHFPNVERRGQNLVIGRRD